jgi:hypothetical protein
MGEFLLFWILQVMVILTGVSIGHSLLRYRIRKEETKKREIELKLLEKKEEILKNGKSFSVDIDDVLYRAKVQKEIDDILRKTGRR